MLEARLVLFILCITGSINTFKIYNFIHDEIPFFFNSDVCNSDICNKDAQNILSSLNASVDPCEDFYEFACGGWLSKNVRPTTEPIWGQWEPIMIKVEKNIENILEDETESSFTALKTAKDIYQACMKTETSEVEDLLVLSKLLQNFGGWPIIQKDWAPKVFWPILVAKINSYLNVHALFNFHVSIDLYNTSQHALYIDHPSFIFPKTVLSDPPAYERHLKAYELFIINSVLEMSSTMNNTNLSVKDVKHDAFEIVKFETKLVNIMAWNENTNNLSHFFKKITIEHLQFLTDLIPRKNDDTKVDWIEVLTALFRNSNVTISKENYIIVKDLSYVVKLINLVERTSPKIIANYLGWSIIKHFSKDSTKNLRKFAFTMDEILHGVHEDIPRKQYCISIINKHIGFAVAHEYVERHFDVEVKREVQDMMETIKLVLTSKLKLLKWLDDSTKMKALEKAKEIGILVGYPDWLKNITYLEDMYKGLDVTKYHILNIISCLQFKKDKELLKLNKPVINERWSGMPTDVNAYYNVLQNVIIFPTGILQYPFYNSKRVQALNYGAIGTIIGHEFSHAFDNTGRQADKNGNLIQWWTKESLEKYHQNIKCFNEHYNKYTIQVLEKTTKRKISMNGEKTQDENIADLIGLDLAYTAYLNMKGTQLDELKLPGLEKYTTEQYFFLSYANQWCEASSIEQMMSDVIEGDHTPTRIRVIGTLSNSESFSRAFNCPIDSPMNPSKKCGLW